jgi:hypothetical protein
MCVRSIGCEAPFICKWGRLSVWAHFHRCGRMRRCGRPLTWTLLILAPKAVEGRFLASILADMAVGRCGRPTSKLWDELPSLGDAQDCLGMTVVAVGRPEKWTHWSKWSQLHPFDQTNISLINLVHPSCARGEGLDWDQGRGTGQVRSHLPGRPHLQGRPCLVVRPCLAHVARWLHSPPLNVYLSIKIATQLLELY